VHRAPPGDDDPGTQKAYARNDLGRDAGRVEFDRARLQDIAEAILTDQQDQRRRRADNGLGPQSRALALDGPFEADQRCQPERRQEFDDLSGALARSIEQRAGQPDLHARQASPTRTNSAR
jgi:hypothetical protein